MNRPAILTADDDPQVLRSGKEHRLGRAASLAVHCTHRYLASL